jgi:hypothetical protein
VLSIYSDRSFLASESTPHAVILLPFWGTNPVSADDPEKDRFDRYAEVGRSYFRLAPLAESEIGVFPQNWESAGERAGELGDAFSSLCRAAGKIPVFFSGTDATEPLPVEGVVFRTSVLRSQRLPNELALPAWSEDFLERYLGGELRLRRKQRRPVVGFCGNTMGGLPAPPSGSRLRRLLTPKAPATSTLRGDHPRMLALQALERDRRVRPNFVLREGFWGHEDVADRTEQRRIYVENMVESDYVLCARGIGNFSYRLYETLSLGRIPVFVDTDCVLPLEDEIEWRDYCVWVDEADIGRIGDRVIEFHESLDEAAFEERQRACRKLWETHISPQGFFSLFHRNFEQP